MTGHRHAHPQPQLRPHRRPARRARARGRAARRGDDLAGRRQGREHLARGRERRAGDRRGAAGPPGRPVRARAGERGHRVPPGRPRRRDPGQPHAHRARRHHHQAQQPRRRRGRRAPRRARRGPGRRSPRAAPGPCWPARCRRPPRRRSTRPRPPAARDRAKVAVDTSEAPLGALVEGLPADAPDLLKPNAEELASVTGADAEALEADPARPRRRPARWSSAASAPCWPPSAARARVLVNAEGAWFAPPPPTAVVSTVGAGDSTCSATCSATCAASRRPDRLALAVAYGSAAAGLPGTTIPAPLRRPPRAGRTTLARLDPT